MRNILACATVVLWGCGSPPGPANHAHFDSIQRQETRIEAAANVVFDEDRSCPERTAASDEACGAAERICTIAAEVEDHDASARCDEASHRCGAMQRAAANCS